MMVNGESIIQIQVVDQVVGFLLQNLTYPIRQTKEAKSGRDLPNPTIFLPYPTISQQDLTRSHQKSFGLLGIYLSLQNQSLVYKFYCTAALIYILFSMTKRKSLQLHQCRHIVKSHKFLCCDCCLRIFLHVHFSQVLELG